MKKDLKTVLAEMGATETQLNSKIFHLTERAIAEDEVDGLETVSKAVDSLADKLDKSNATMASQLRSSVAAMKNLDVHVGAATRAMNEIDQRMNSLNAAVDSVTVKDPGIMDAINAYTLILTRTKEVLGEDAMTEAVLVQLLETASYGLWRSIMGPKNVNDKRY